MLSIVYSESDKSMFMYNLRIFGFYNQEYTLGQAKTGGRKILFSPLKSSILFKIFRNLLYFKNLSSF